MRGIGLVGRGVAACLLCVVASFAAAQTPPPPPARVMFMGVFHFANPGRDMVKSSVIDVMAPENQAYLSRLATRVAAFAPTDVLIECSPSEQGVYDARFADYLAGRFEATSNENYQIGFRVAKAAGLDGVICFDEDTIGWQGQPLFEHLERQEPATKASMDAFYKQLSAESEREQTTLPLPRLLQLANDPSRDALNKDSYLRTNAVDAGKSFVGADASASWWHRNFRMYANVQKVAAPGRRVFVVAGQGHTAILKDLLAIDGQREAEDVRRYLDDPAPK